MTTPDTTDEDPRLMEALREYQADLDAGRRPDRRAVAARLPDLAPSLLPYLEALDAVHRAAPQLRDPSSAAPAARALEPTPEPLGDFRIVREIGRGGMGVVYEAVQLSLGRRVALKVLPFAAALDARQLQRFRNEAHAAAQLHHTNIVPVHAVGCERGVHFYAMQLIDGQNLDALIAQLRGGERADLPGDLTGPDLSPDAPARPAAETRTLLGAQLSTQRGRHAGDYYRTAAGLIAQAAEGLDYAHSLGIVHRDVKPANLLVDGRGTVWVTDFGLAQFHAEAGLTQTGDLLGTLRYMSPEQAGGHRLLLDHRTDVYSLGATLYELLTLKPLFDGSDRPALLRQILNDEPRAPRAADRAVPPELETVVIKALAKAPAERYASCRELADDLRRFLRHEPVRARRATLTQRARKWVRRHPSVPAAGAVLLLLLALGSLVSAALLGREQEKTRAAYERERLRAEEAEQQFRLARRSVDDMIQVAEEELSDKPPLQAARRRLLEAALSYYQEFIERRQDDPDAQADLTATQARVRKILDELTVLQGAGQIHLLAHPAVLADLKPSARQRETVGELANRLAAQQRETFEGYHRLSAEQRRARVLELARANDEAVTGILTPEQLARLRQIALQVKGAAAFQEPEIATALKLRPDQREQIRGIQAEAFFGPPEGLAGPGPRGPMAPHPGGPRGPRDGFDERYRAALGRVLAVLSDEQREKWREMAGEPFKGVVGPFPGGYPGGFQGPFSGGPRGPRK